MDTHYLAVIGTTIVVVQGLNLWWFHGNLKECWDRWRAAAAARIRGWLS